MSLADINEPEKSPDEQINGSTNTSSAELSAPATKRRRHEPISQYHLSSEHAPGTKLLYLG